MRRRKSKQGELWVTTEEITKPASHPFCAKVNAVLDECKFDRKAEQLCQRFYRPDANADALNSGRGVSRTGIKMPFSICDFNFDLLRFISNAWRSSQIKRLTRLCLIAMLSFHGTPTVSGVVSPGSGSERAGFGKSTRASTAITRRNHPAVDNSTGL
jgi:hypothetical protein